jgi:hypothetical protein
MNEAPEDGRVEDGTLTACVVCGIERYLYDADKGVCEHCSDVGWAFTHACLLRRGDTMRLPSWPIGDTVLVDADEPMGKRLMIHAANDRCWVFRSLDPVLVRQ